MADNLGIPNQTKSSALGSLQEGPRLRQLLNSIPAGQEANMLGQQIQQLQGQESSGLLDQLMSPKGLALALGTLLAGKEFGGEGAAAFGLGGVQGMQAQQASEEQTKADAIEKLQEQRDKALDRADKAVQRVSTAFNTNPDAFVDPETGEPVIAPEDLGFLATGVEGIKLFPQTRRKLNEATENKKRRYELITTALETTESVPEAKVLLKSGFTLLGYQPEEGELDAMANAMGTPEWTPTLANMIAKNATNPGEVFNIASERGLPLEHPDVITAIDWMDPALMGGEAMTTAKQRALAMQRFVDWTRNPDNRVTVQQIKDEADDKGEEMRLLLQAAFPEEEPIQADLTNYLNAEPDRFERLVTNLKQIRNVNEFARQISGYDQLPFIRNMTEKEYAQWEIQQAIAMDEAQTKEIRGQEAIGVAKQRNDLKGRIKTELRKSEAVAEEIARDILKAAIKASRDELGRPNREAFEKAVEVEYSKAVKDIRGE